jgi:outer membrane lipoprotein-sorting protein
MLRFLAFLLMLNFYSPVFSSAKEKIIAQMKLTDTLSFNFTQTIDNKNENGSCIIKYPKKIFCEYDGPKRKIVVSNGKLLAIKIRNNGNFFLYPLKKTPLNLLLDKEYLLSKINALEPRNIDNKFLTFKLFDNGNEINIFFGKKDFDLVGWQTKDIYQKIVITFISSVKSNEKVDNKIFRLPVNN